MDLGKYLEDGLAVAEYTELLSKDQGKLHALYERRATIDEDAVATIQASDVCRAIVITEPWCGDSLAVFPVVAKLFELAGVEVRILRRDEHPELIDKYLTNGGRAIPIVIGLDNEFSESFHWGPRPEPAQKIYDQHRVAIAQGDIDKKEVHKKLRLFYAKDKGQTTVAELTRRAST